MARVPWKVRIVNNKNVFPALEKWKIILRECRTRTSMRPKEDDAASRSQLPLKVFNPSLRPNSMPF